MQYSKNAGQVRCRTGHSRICQMQERTYAVTVRSDAGGQVRCITKMMQDRTEAVQDRCRKGRMQYRTYAVHDNAVQDICSA